VFGPSVPTYIYIAIDAAVFLMKGTGFDKLLDWYLKGRLKAEERQRVENWLDHLAGIEPFDGLSENEQADIGANIYKHLSERARVAKRPARLPPVVRLRPLLKMASCIALFGALVFGFRVRLKELFNIGQYTLIANVKGHITKRILTDGSIVWLKGDSKLHFPVRFKDSLREVGLEGEALFEVAKDAAHPFVIHCGTLTTRVLGTSFNIRQNHDQTEVDVLTGRVYLSSENTNTIALLPYQKGLYYRHKKTLVKEARPALQIADLTKGTEYDMLFNDVPLAEVVQRIEDKFEVNIKVEGRELNSELVTADFTDQSLNNTLNMVCEALGLGYGFKGQLILLKEKAHRLK